MEYLPKKKDEVKGEKIYMSKRTKTAILNWTMLISLIVVFVSGILLKPFPGMWLGISHAVSGLVLFVSALIHSIKHMRKM